MEGHDTQTPTSFRSRLPLMLARIRSSKRLRRCLSRMSSAEVDQALAQVGRNRAQLFTDFKGNAKHRRRMIFMMRHFRVDPDFATHSHWEALRRADSACFTCHNVPRCKSWMSWGARNDAPRVFCPNAELFDEIACGERQRSAA